MTGTSRHASVWTELPFMRGPQGADRLRQWGRAQSEIKRQCAARRERVLAYDWARRRLCAIFGYTRAENWNGYVPPARDSEDLINTSPGRRQLMDLLRDVALFEQNEGVADGENQVDQAGA